MAPAVMVIHLVLAGESEVFDLHLPLAATREEDLLHTRPLSTVHHCDGASVGAHPDELLPDCETCTCAGVVVWHWNLHL